MDIPSTLTRTARDVGPDKIQTSLDVVLRCFVGALDADTGMLLGFDSERRPELLAATGYAARKSTVPWTSGTFLGKALVTDGVSLEAASGFHDHNSSAASWHAVASQIPGETGPLGAIYAGWERASPLDRDHLSWIADSHAQLAALCMSEGGAEVASVLRSSGVDPLTGCLRYERVLDMLRAEVQRSLRQGHQLSVCFFDIDHFKAINDEHGHLTGNKVLASAGEALLASARGFDCIGRFGGDEFVVVMPETSLPDGRRAAARMSDELKRAVEQSTGLQITASTGVAEWHRKQSMLQLLEASDRALQLAKASGGARVHSVPPGRRFDGFLGLVRRTQIRTNGSSSRSNGDR